MAEIKQDITNRKSSQKPHATRNTIKNNTNSTININNNSQVSLARERFDRAINDKGYNPKKRVRIITDSSASEHENAPKSPVIPKTNQPPILPVNVDPIDKKQQILDNKFNTLTDTLNSIANNVASLSRENTPPPFVPEYNEDDDFEYEEQFDNEGFPVENDEVIDPEIMDLVDI